MIYIVLKIDETGNLNGEVVCIKKTHIEAYKMMVKLINKNRDDSDIVNVIDNDRTEVFRLSKGYLKNSKDRKFIFIIQKFDENKKKSQKITVSKY